MMHTEKASGNPRLPEAFELSLFRNPITRDVGYQRADVIEVI
jgi:hypothetical protein